jgi:hypothetical protein
MFLGRRFFELAPEIVEFCSKFEGRVQHRVRTIGEYAKRGKLFSTGGFARE